jgi:hypothetical protein
MCPTDVIASSPPDPVLTTSLNATADAVAAPVRRRDSLRAQTPAAMLMVAAVAALLMVNRVPAPQADLAAAACNPCGEVVAVRPVTASKFGLPQVPEGSLALDVRMGDGSVRTIRSDDRNVHIGMRVPVTGGAVLSSGS